MLHINGSLLAHLPGVSANYAPILAAIIFGIFPIVAYLILSAILIHWVCMLSDFSRRIYKRMSLVQLATTYIFLILMLSLPIKIMLRLLFNIKYVWVTPWFSV
jgi:hypothetical protein